MRDRTRRAAQTVKQRDSALQQICINLCDQETAQQREARLHRMSERQSERLAVKSAEGRVARLQRTAHNTFNNDACINLCDQETAQQTKRSQTT